MDSNYNIELFSFFSDLSKGPLPVDFFEQIENRFEVDFSSTMGKIALPLPLILSVSEQRILFSEVEKIAHSGFSGLVFPLPNDIAHLGLLVQRSKEKFTQFPLVGSLDVVVEKGIDIQGTTQRIFQYFDTGLDALKVDFLLEGDSLGNLHLELTQILANIENKMIFPGLKKDLFSLKDYWKDWGGKFEGLILNVSSFDEKFSALRVLKEIKTQTPEESLGVEGKFFSGQEIFEFLHSGADFSVCQYHEEYESLIPFKTNNPYRDYFHHLFLNPENGLLRDYL